MSLQNAAGLNLFEFFFTGGQSSYQKNDSGGIQLTGKGFTDDGFSFWLTQNSGGAYTGSLGGTAVSGNFITQTDLNIAKIRVFTYNTNGFATTDTFFNSLSVTPEPSRALLILVGAMGLMMRRRR